MEDEVSKPKRSSKKAKPPLTVEAAQAKILAKLQKEGPKGTTTIHGKASTVDAESYVQAIAALEGEDRREIFVDRRGAKPKYYLWVHRPKLPTPETIAGQILAFAQGEHPRIHSAATFTKKLALTKDGKSLVPAALEWLCSRTLLTVLEFAPTTRKQELYAVTAAFKSADPAPALFQGPLTLEVLKPAYDALVEQSGFPAVPIASLQKAAAVPMEALKDLLRRERDAGGVVLSIGDWSIASEEERQGVIEMHGRNYLQVRWQL